jgi:hypothetical protein
MHSEATPTSRTAIHDHVSYLSEELENGTNYQMEQFPDSPQSETLVSKRDKRLAIGFFILIGLLLLTAMGSFEIYGHHAIAGTGLYSHH